MSFSAGFAAGLAVGKKKWKAGDDDWQPPEWWIPVPEPGEYDIYILIQVIKPGVKFQLTLGDSLGDSGRGTVHYDWGDGTEDILDQEHFIPPKHAFAEAGQYLIHITGDGNAYFFRNLTFMDKSEIVGLIIKTGSKIAYRIDYYDEKNYSYDALFAGKSFKYIKAMHPDGLPFKNATADYFTNCYGLNKIELAKKISGDLPKYTFYGCQALKNLKQFSIDCENITSVGLYAFADCYQLENINFPNCTSIEEYAFDDCRGLMSVNIPSCTAVDNYGFTACYNLQEFIAADGCTFGTSCFQNCYSLYPRPDGSIN